MEETRQSILHKLNQNLSNPNLDADTLDGKSSSAFPELDTANIFTKLISMTGLAEYIDDAAAVTGGLVTGDLYTTSGAIKIVV